MDDTKPASSTARLDLFPPIEPYASGMLEVSDGNSVYWETCGNPRGKPALVVHGGAGIGCTERMRRAFELSIQSWLLSGGSWGTTLALAYAERFPEHVSELVLMSVTLSRKREIDWLYGGVSRFFPEEWRSFCESVAETERNDLVAAYARLMEQPSEREQAAQRWSCWEDAVVSLEPDAKPRLYSDRPTAALLAFVRICSNYFANAAWLEDDELLRNATRLKDIRGAIIHGRLDLSCPVHSAWELAQVWKSASFERISQAGHQGNALMRDALLRAHAKFA